MLGFFDLSTFFSVSVLILWGLVLPILRPIASPDFQLYLFDQKSLAMGLYTGLILCSLVVVFRIALQFLITRSTSTVMIIPAPPKPIVINQTEVKEKNSIEDSLSSIRSEIALLREEISSLSVGRVWASKSSVAPTIDSQEDSPGWAFGDANPISSFSATPIGEARTSPPLVQRPTWMDGLITNAGVSNTIPSPEYEPTTGVVQLPDSAKDNPWAFVLSGRQARAMPPVEPRVIPVETQVVSEPQSMPVEPDSLPLESKAMVTETLVPKVEPEEVTASGMRVTQTEPQITPVEPEVIAVESPVANVEPQTMEAQDLATEPEVPKVELQDSALATPAVIEIAITKPQAIEAESIVMPLEPEVAKVDTPGETLDSQVSATEPQIQPLLAAAEQQNVTVVQAPTVESPSPVGQKKRTRVKRSRRKKTAGTKSAKTSVVSISQDN